MDRHAHATHVLNFGGAHAQHGAHDIRDINAAEYREQRIGGASGPDVIIGGPPCQPFTRVGRAKLREVARMADAHVHDARVTLYEHFLRFVDELRPRAFVMENVPDLCSFEGRNIAEEIAASADALGYNARYALLNAVWYGTPQLRERVVIIAFRRDLGIEPRFPVRTHRFALPNGYATARVAEGIVPVVPPHDHYAGEPEPAPRRLSAVTVRQAIGDLPPIREHLAHMQSRRGARRFVEPVEYLGAPACAYQRLMRDWPGLPHGGAPADHVIRYTPRDYATFRRMMPRDQYPEAHAIALRRFDEALRREERKTGRKLREGSSRWTELRAAIVPPYDATKFPNKWQKLADDEPAHTLTAHLGKDTYSHIHPDSAQARMISVREAARLQSFPDSFRFAGSMNTAFKQIGNSVPPLMAMAIARSVLEQLKLAADATTNPAVHDEQMEVAV